jgi:hypothetical protein
LDIGVGQGSVATWATLREAARRSETSLLINPALVPLLLFFLGIGVIGAYARRFVINRFGLDLTREAAGVCLLLFAGAAWGLSQHDNPAASTAGVWLALLAITLSFLVLGAWTLGGETRSPRTWLLYILLAALFFALVAIVLLVIVAMTLPTGWSIA